MKNERNKIEYAIFLPAVILLVAVLTWTVVDYSSFATFSNEFIELVKNTFGSFINLVIFACLIILFYLLLSKKGDIVIGGKDAKPDVSFFSYFTMSLCGVIGVGIVFWGIAEPITHYMNPPSTMATAGGTPEAAIAALGACFTHWSFPLYGIYSVVGLVMAIAIYTYKLPVRISSMFYPVIGDRIYGGLGKGIDSFCIFCYICATGTTFSFAALQLTAGVSHFTGIAATKMVSVAIIVGISIIYTASSISGIKKGVSYSSQINFGAYIALMVFTFLAVNPQFVTELFTDGLAFFLQDRFIAGTLETDAFRVTGGWYQGWPVFYFVWGIATALVTSVFLAKISKGRTIRQFIIVNLILPSCFALLWFGVFGGAGIYLETFTSSGIFEAMTEKGTEFAAYEFFSTLPLPMITIPLFFLAAAVSFTTCANSVVTAMASMSQKVEEEDAGKMTEPPMLLKLTYALLVCGISIAVIFLGGAKEVQAAAVAAGLPTAVLIVLGIVGLFRFLSPAYAKKHLKDSKDIDC